MDEYTECEVGPDHEIRTVYEGGDGWLGECDLCGAEFWEDKNASPEEN